MKRITLPQEPKLDALPGKEEILARLASQDPDVVKPVLRLLCPCRYLTYDREIWSRMAQIVATHSDWYVQEAARHALNTLQERSRFDSRAVELLTWLSEHPFGEGLFPRWLRQELSEGTERALRFPKVALRDVPTLIEALASDSPEQQRDALTALCPGRSRRYNARVWLAIAEARRVPDPVRSERAGRALQRLLSHARGDPYAAQSLKRLQMVL